MNLGKKGCTLEAFTNVPVHAIIIYIIYIYIHVYIYIYTNCIHTYIYIYICLCSSGPATSFSSRCPEFIHPNLGKPLAASTASIWSETKISSKLVSSCNYIYTKPRKPLDLPQATDQPMPEITAPAKMTCSEERG